MRLDLSQQVIEADPAAKNRYIVRNGKLIPAPFRRLRFLTSPLFSPLGKVRLLSDVLSRPRVEPSMFLWLNSSAVILDLSSSTMRSIRSSSGVYAGNPSRLSARHAFPKLWQIEQQHGSLIRGQIAEAKSRKARAEPAPAIFSFPDGLQTLTDTIVRALTGRLHRVQRVSRSDHTRTRSGM